MARSGRKTVWLSSAVSAVQCMVLRSWTQAIMSSESHFGALPISLALPQGCLSDIPGVSYIFMQFLSSAPEVFPSACPQDHLSEHLVCVSSQKLLPKCVSRSISPMIVMEQLMSSPWTCRKHLTLSHTSFLSLSWWDMDLTDRPFDG